MSIYSALKKILKVFSRISLTCIGLIGIGFGALIIRLQQGPLPLEGIWPYLEIKMAEIVPDFKIQVSHPELIWPHFEDSLKIKFQNVKIQRLNETFGQVSAAEIALTFRLQNLFSLNFDPSGIEIIAPHLNFEGHDFFKAPDQGKPREDFLLQAFHQLLKSDPSSRPSSLRSLKVSQATITINDPQGWGIWSFPQTDIHLTRTPYKFNMDLQTVWKDQLYKVSFHHTKRNSQIWLEVDLPYITTEITKIIPSDIWQSASPETFNFLKIFQENPLPFSLLLKGSYNDSTGFKEGQLEVKTFPSVLNLNPFLPGPVPLEKALIQLNVQYNQWVLSQALFELDHRIFNLSGSGMWDISHKQLSYSIKTYLGSTPFTSLFSLWPETVASVPRIWLQENIPQAQLTQATCYIEGILQKTPNSYQGSLKKITGSIDFNKGTVRYLDTLPALENLSGKGTFDRENFRIHLTQGSSTGITLSAADLVIHDLHLKDQTLDIKADLHSRLENVLKFIDRPPLLLAQAHGLDKLSCTGHADVHLFLNLPLEVKIEPKDIKVKTNAHLTNVMIKKPLNSLNINVSKGDFKLTIEEGRAHLEGDCLLNESPAHLHYQKTDPDKGPSQTQLHLNSTLSPQFFKSLGYSVSTFLEGNLPTQVTYLEKEPGGIGELKLSCDLKPVKIKGALGSKPAGRPASLIALLSLQNEKIKQVKQLDISCAPDLSLKAQASFYPDGKTPQEIKLTQVQWGLTKFKGSILKSLHGPYQVHINGKIFNIEPFMQNKKADQNFSLPADGVQFFAHFNELQVDPHLRLFDNTLTFKYQKDLFTDLKFKSYIKDQKNAKDLVYAVIEPQPQGKRRFTLQTESAGLLVRSLGIPVKMYGGKFQLYALKDDTKVHSPWQGKMRILNFTVREVPVLGQLLSLAFPTGMADLLSSKGLPFRRFSTHFSLTPQKIFLSKGIAKGNSLGITLHGVMDRSFEHINLNGSVIPAYMLNSLLAKIPLIGELLTGGKNEGIFSVSYAIEGSRDHPKVSINPISVFTPGFLRRIFEGPTEEEDEDEDDNDKES